MLRMQCPRHLRHFRLRILDRLRLVEDDETELALQEYLSVEQQQRIADDDDVGRVDRSERFLAPGALKDQQSEFGREAADFLLPIAENAHRRHDQRGLVQAILLLLDGKMSQRLHRLSQAHVVGQDAAQTMAAQKLQPSQAVLLVGPQRRLKMCGRGQRFDAGKILDRVNEVEQRRIIGLQRGCARLERELRQPPGLSCRQAQRLALVQGVLIAQFHEHVGNALNPCQWHRQIASVLQADQQVTADEEL